MDTLSTFIDTPSSCMDTSSAVLDTPPAFPATPPREPECEPAPRVPKHEASAERPRQVAPHLPERDSLIEKVLVRIHLTMEMMLVDRHCAMGI